MNEFLKPIIKKLNNFKLTALLATIGGLVGLLLTVLLFIFYSRSGVDPSTGNVVPAFFGGITPAAPKGNPSLYIVGMVYFLFLIVSTILCIVIIYLSFPYLFPRDVMSPKKALPWLVVSEGALHFALIIMTIFLLIIEDSRMKVGFIIYIILGALFLIYSLLFILPGLKCRFYMPSLLEENKK